MAGLLDLLWPALIRQESGGNPFAVSPKGAFGRAQLMPDTARDPGFGVRPFDPTAPNDNERMGRDYFQAMLDRYNNDPKRALVAYNWGPGNADKWNGQDSSLPRETRGYVKNILGSQPQMQPMMLGSAAEDLPTMPPMQGMPFDTPTGGMEEPSIPQLQRDFIPPMQAAPSPPPSENPDMPDPAADPVSQLLAQYLSQSGGQSQGLLGQIFPGINNTRVGGLLNNSDLQNKLMSVGAGLASGRGWGPGFGAGVGMYMANRQNDIENQRQDLMTKLGLAKALSPSTEFQTLKADDGSERLVGITKPAFGGEPKFTMPEIPGLKTNDTTIADIGKAIKSGRQPPVLTGLYSKAAPVRAWLERNGVDLTSANLDWQKATKQIAALNGPQMTRYAGLAKSVIATITDVKELAKELDNGGFSDYNKAKLEILVRTRGNTPEGILATRYLAATTLLEEEIANLAQGGGVPTEPAFELAKKQIQGGYGAKQITASLEEVERLLNYRLQAIPNMGSLGPDSANRYTNNPGTAPGIHDPAVTGAPPPPPGFVVQP
jgi:hypothetical protein